MISSVRSVFVRKTSRSVDNVGDLGDGRCLQSGLVPALVVRALLALSVLLVIAIVNLVDQTFMLWQVCDDKAINDLKETLGNRHEALDNRVVNADGVF